MADRWVCLLRGVNVGGRKVAMADLRELFAELGHEDVATYIQSGNVVFTSRSGPAGKKGADKLTDAIRKGIEREIGLEVTVLLRTPDELAGAAARTPFPGADHAKLHVTFLEREPEEARVAAIDPHGFPPDQFVVFGKDVHLHCPDGYGRSKLTNAFWEKKLGVAATTRNWRTLNKLLEMAGDSE